MQLNNKTKLQFYSSPYWDQNFVQNTSANIPNPQNMIVYTEGEVSCWQAQGQMEIQHKRGI